MKDLCRHFANINTQYRKGRLLKSDLGAALSGSLTSDQKSRLTAHIRWLHDYAKAPIRSANDIFGTIHAPVEKLAAEISIVISSCSIKHTQPMAA
jgi:hypothetical protein